MDNLHELSNLLHWSLYHNVANQFADHVHGRVIAALDAGDRRRAAITTQDELEQYRTQMREAFLHGVGGLPVVDVPLSPQVTGEMFGDRCRIEKIIFQSRPQVYVTGNLYLPESRSLPTAAILFCCGHHQQAKAVAEYQSVCLRMVDAGFVVFSFDPIGQGERESYYEPVTGISTVRWGSGEHDYAGTQCWPLGEAIARFFLHDAMRALDYLVSRPEVDPARIGVTGNSGGGYQTALLMLCDPRVAAAAPATYLTGRREYLTAGEQFDAEQIFPMFGALGYDHDDFLLGMAPKPVLVLAVASDFFPIDGTRKTVERCRRFWEMSGNQDRLALFIDDSTHAYTTRMADAAADFFVRHLLDGKSIAAGTSVTCHDPDTLYCTTSGSVRGDFSSARFVYEENQLRLDALEAERQAIPRLQRQERFVEWLRSAVRAPRRPVDLAPRRTLNEIYAGLGVTFSYWWSQEGVMNCACFFRVHATGEQRLPVTIAIWNGGTRALSAHIRWIRQECEKGRQVVVLDVTGAGQLAPNPINKYPDPGFVGTTCMLACNLASLGDSLPALRTWDILRTVDLISARADVDAGDIRLYGDGSYAIYARLAGAIDPRIRSVDGCDDFTGWTELVRNRHYEPEDIMSLVIPGVLAIGDLSDLPCAKTALP